MIAIMLAATASCQQSKTQVDASSKIGQFLKKTFSKHMSKLVDLPKVSGDDSFFVEVVCAWTPGQEASPIKGLRLTGFHYLGGDSSITESVFVDEDELVVLAAGLRAIVSEAKSAEETDFGDLGKEKAMTTIRITSVEGAAFTHDGASSGAT